MTITRADALALDAADELAHLGARFAIAEDDRIYLDGNSLGHPPRNARAALEALLDDWEARLVGGWADWIGWPTQLGDALGGPLLGARPGETLVCDSVTVNLFKLAGAALRDRPGAVVAFADDFPTDRYVAEGLGREVRLLEGEVTPEVVAQAAEGAALVVASHVHYRSGRRADLAAVTEAAHAAGALILWDLSHSVGAVAIDLPGAGADLAVGCTYKFCCAGPGAPALLWVREDLIDGLTSPIQGWFGQADQFAMGPGYRPAAGIERFLAGTPPIVALATVAPGAAALAEAGMDAVEAKGAALTGLAIDIVDGWPVELGFTLGTPRAAAERGAHVALHHAHGWQVCRALAEQARVVGDFRAPDVVRLGMPALTTRFVDVFDALSRLHDLVGAGAHLAVDPARPRVT